MHTASTTCKPATKRRRLFASASSSTVDTLVYTTPEVPRPVDSNAHTAVCSSCHRSCPKPGMVVMCARCRAPTCTICMRTCTARPALPLDDSFPPTPALTLSPTPPPATPLPSPRRPALALSAMHNANTPPHMYPISQVHMNAHTARRRKRSPDTEDTAAPKWAICEKGAGEEDVESEAGCARMVCRTCAVESVQSGLVTCLDCWNTATSVERDSVGWHAAAMPEWSVAGGIEPARPSLFAH